MKNKQKKILGLLACLFLAGEVQAGELADLFGQYQDSLGTGDRSQVASAAEAVYVYVSKQLPESSKNRAAATLNYGKSLVAVRKYAKAEVILQQALVSYEQIYGENSVEVVDPLLELALLRAQLTAAAPDRVHYRGFLNRALDIVANVHGSDSELFAQISLDAGRMALDNAGDATARTYLETAYKAFSGPYRTSRKNRMLANLYLGKYHLARQRYGEAEPFLAEAVAISDRDAQADTHYELTARAFLVEVYERLGETEKSIAQCRAIGAATPFDPNQEPRPLFRPAMKYPPLALQARREGYAVVNFTISDSGEAEDIHIVVSKGSRGFGAAAEEFLQAARFAPRFVDGKPIDTPNMKMKFSFNLTN